MKLIRFCFMIGIVMFAGLGCQKKMVITLHEAALQGQTDVVAKMIADGADVNGKNENGQTPLHLAALFTGKDITELLLSKGAQVNAKDNNGKTPLHLAAATGHKEIVQLLLDKGADINAKDNFGSTPLHAALHSYSVHEDVATLLKARGGVE